MRAVLDTNILVSGLISANSTPARLLYYWRQERFTLLTCAEQLDELRRVTRYPKISARLTPALAGRLLNDLRNAAQVVSNLPILEVSRDPWDNYLLALAQKGHANVLVTGDKADLLDIGRHGSTEILAAREWLERLEN